VGSSLGARLLSSAAAILLLASPAQATVTSMSAFTGGDALATLEASLQRPAPAATIPSSAEFIEFAPQINIDYAEIFDFDRGPISEPAATADIAQMALVAASANLSSAARNSRFQSIDALDLLRNGLGPTSSVKRGRLSSSDGLDSSILRVFFLILVTVLVAFAVIRWKLS
jgi:hypothetical protein